MLQLRTITEAGAPSVQDAHLTDTWANRRHSLPASRGRGPTMQQLALGHQGLAPSDRAERPASPAFSGASSRLLQLDPELLQTMAAKVRKLKFCRALSQERRYSQTKQIWTHELCSARASRCCSPVQARDLVPENALISQVSGCVLQQHARRRSVGEPNRIHAQLSPPQQHMLVLKPAPYSSSTDDVWPAAHMPRSATVCSQSTRSRSSAGSARISAGGSLMGPQPGAFVRL